MKQLISAQLAKHLPLKKEEITKLIEIPQDAKLGDYAFPCFAISQLLKKPPQQIANELSQKINSKTFEKIQPTGPYLNFFINRKLLAKEILTKTQKQNYGKSNLGKNKKIVIEFSSPNIAKPFGIGHLRSTIIGNSLSKLAEAQGYKTIKINYLGDWGTPFGKIIASYKKFGSPTKLKRNPINHLLELYVKATNLNMELEGREEFKKLELGDKEVFTLWKKFREISIKEFNKTYQKLNIKFDIVSGESFYNKKMEQVVGELSKKSLLKNSQGAQIINLENKNLGIVLVKKSDGATLYATRDLAAAIDRYRKYKFEKMIYEVGQEQTLHFKQIFEILKLLGNNWAKNCIHVSHGLYLDKNGKKFATRKGKTIFMENILEETKVLAKSKISEREILSEKELEKRAEKIAIAAILYGDLKNHLSNNIIFDINRFLSFEGNTGPYLLYTYARARSILKKTSEKPSLKNISQISDLEKSLIFQLAQFPEVVTESFKSLAPNIVANYAHGIAQTFNEFYHSTKVINSKEESFRLILVDSFSKVLKKSLNLLGISTIETM